MNLLKGLLPGPAVIDCGRGKSPDIIISVIITCKDDTLYISIYSGVTTATIQSAAVFASNTSRTNYCSARDNSHLLCMS
jgi:hypothetical protein